MSSTERQLLDVRVIGTTFRVAAASHPAQLAGAVRRARRLLADARSTATSLAVREAIAAVEAEVETAGATARLREA